MNIRNNDIVIRRFQDTTTIWVSERYICEVLGIEMEEYLRCRARVVYRRSVSPCYKNKDILPDTGRAWRYARINGQVYYDYDRIPDRRDTQYRTRLGDRDDILNAADVANEAAEENQRKAAELELIERVYSGVNNEEIRLFRFKETEGACKFNQDSARQMTEALSWLRLVDRMVRSKEYVELGIRKQEEFFEFCANILHKRNLQGLSIRTGGSLRKKLHYFPKDREDQIDYLISNKFGNDNARKLGKDKFVDTNTGEIFSMDIHQALITDLWMNPGGAGKGSKIELWNEYCEDVAYMGLEAMSYSTFCHYTNMYDHRFKASLGRHGEKYFNSTYLPYISSKKPVYGNSLWCADGSGTIGYRYLDSQGKLRSMRLYVMMISDVATGKIVGWCPQRQGLHSETHTMLKEAMLMGLRGCDKKEVMELISDNGSVFTSDEGRAFLEQICRHHRTIEPGNSQANFAETQFRLFKKRLRRMANWMGTSWDAKSIENKANPDDIDITQYPTYKEAINQLEEKIDSWNNDIMHTGESRSELYAKNMHPDCKEIDDRIWRRFTGRYSPYEITRQRGTIILESKGKRYKFDIPDFEVLGETIQAYLGYASLVQTNIYWDNESADVYTEDDRYMFTCFATPLASTTHAEADHDSMAAIGKGIIRKTKARDKVKQFADDTRAVIEALAESEVMPYEIACRQTKHAKEWSNGEREAAMEAKAQQSTKRKRETVTVDSEDESRDEYMRMREKLYKNN